MDKITEEITYTTGTLAKKLGISKSRLMRHLHATGLIEQCGLTKGGHWRIPYSIAARISSAEALSLPLPTPISRQTMPRNNRGSNNRRKVSPPVVNEPKPVSVSVPDYAQIGRALRQAGITMADVVKYFEQQMEVTHTQNNSARDENQADGSKTTS